MHQRTKFWMVWSPQGHGPTYQHDSRDSADKEARRLALACPSQDFFVLKAMGGFRAVPTLPTEPDKLVMNNDEIPF